MSNIRRMLMMLANDLPKRESISYHKRYISTDIEWGNYFIVNPTNINSRTNSSSTFGSCMEVSKGDVVVLNTATYSALIGYALFDADGNYANIQEYGNGNLYVLYNIDVNNNGYIGFNCKSARYSDFYLDLTRTLSQEAYDYALSFGKKCVKDLKKAIEESDNPAMLIKRINDWKYVIHSLVDTGYTSWLKGDGSAYIDTGVFGSGDTITEVVVRNNRTTADSSITCGVLGAMSSYTSRNYTLFYSSDSGMYIFNGYNTTYPKISPKGAYCNGVLKKDKGDLYYNGGLINSIDYASFTTQYAMYLFAFNRQGSATGLSNNIYISRCDINGSNIFVPYYNGSEYCMLDINSGIIYENANVVDGVKVGAFDWMLTDKDGNEVYDLYTNWEKGYYWSFATKSRASSSSWHLQKIDVSNYRRMIALFDNSLENKAGTYFVDENNSYIEDSRISNGSITEQEYTIPMGAKYLCISTKAVNGSISNAYVKCYY